eukprot:1159631-Pelagomonas_calceolata.AAC.6
MDACKYAHMQTPVPTPKTRMIVSSLLPRHGCTHTHSESSRCLGPARPATQVSSAVHYTCHPTARNLQGVLQPDARGTSMKHMFTQLALVLPLLHPIRAFRLNQCDIMPLRALLSRHR